MNSIRSECSLCKLFSSPAKIMVIEELSSGPKTVSELVKRTKISQSQISQCLAAMKAQDLVFYQREGKFVRYQLAYPEMKDALQIFRKILQKRNRRYIKPAKR